MRARAVEDHPLGSCRRVRTAWTEFRADRQPGSEAWGPVVKHSMERRSACFAWKKIFAAAAASIWLASYHYGTAGPASTSCSVLPVYRAGPCGP